jgi:hypothetical protein
MFFGGTSGPQFDNLLWTMPLHFLWRDSSCCLSGRIWHLFGVNGVLVASHPLSNFLKALPAPNLITLVNTVGHSIRVSRG